ncbi:MAG: hypothetical protein Q4C20_08375 [Erysipelotrichaceae bacterium]|nr:hypothetical protein [Erysipelotrichaceae bacterium]
MAYDFKVEGVQADFIIVAVNQRKRIKKYDNNVVIDEVKRNWLFPMMNIYGFYVFQSLKGWWYTISPQDFNDDYFFDLGDVDQESAAGNYPVKVNEKWENTVYHIIEYYLACTDSESIAVMFRLDYPKREVLHSTITLDEFWDNLKKGNIYFDEAYFLSNNLQKKADLSSVLLSDVYWKFKNKILDFKKNLTGK